MISQQVLLFILRMRDDASAGLNAARLAAVGLAGAMGALAVASGRAYLEFDRAMTNMASLVGVPQRQLERFQEQINQLAVSSGRGPTELANSLYFVVSSGFEGAEALDILTASAQAAAAGLGQTEKVADVVTSAMNAYGPANLRAADATGQLIAAVKVGKLEADQLSVSIGQVIPNASAAGVEFWELSAAMAAMSLAGINAARGGTMIRQTLQDVIAPSDVARKKLAEVFGSAEEGVARMQAVFRDQGYLAGIQWLRDNFSEIDLRKIVNDAEALSGMLQLTGANADRTRQVFDEMRASGEANLRTAFEIARQSDSVKWDQGIAIARIAMINFGEAIMNVVIPAIGFLVDTYDFLVRNWDAVVAVANVFISVLVGIATIYIPLLIARLIMATAAFNAYAIGVGLAGTGTATLSGFMLALTRTAIPALMASLRALWALMLAHPMMLLIAAGTALVTLFGLLGDSTGTLTDATRDQIDAAGDVGVAWEASYEQALKNVEAQERLAAQNQNTSSATGVLTSSAYGAAIGMAAMNQDALRLTQGLERLGLMAQWTAVQLAHSQMMAARGRMIEAREQRRQAYAAGTPGIWGVVQRQTEDARFAGATNEFGAATDVLGQNLATFAQARQTAAQIQRAGSAPPGARPGGTRGGGGGGGGGGRSDRESEEEKFAKRVLETVQALDLQAAAYGRTAEQSDFYSSMQNLGIDLAQQQFAAYQDVNEAVTMTDEVANSNSRLNAIREVATAIQARQTAAMNESIREMGLERANLTQLAGLRGRSARERAIETAVINAATEAAREHRIILAAEEEAIRKRAAAQYDFDVEDRIYEQTIALTENADALDAQAQAYEMDSRAAAIFLARQEAATASLRENGRVIDDLVLRAGENAAKQFDLQNRQISITEGWNSALEAMSKKAGSVGLIIQNGLTGAFDAISTAMARFVSGQKVGWRELLGSVLQSITQMIAQMLLWSVVVQTLRAIGVPVPPWLSGGGGGGAPPSPRKFAKGGDFTNQVIQQATMFAYGQGQLGVMGEAGPEAVMPLINGDAVYAYASNGQTIPLPLQRGPDGKLGVRLDAMEKLGMFADGGAFASPMSQFRGGTGVQIDRGIAQEGDVHIHAPVEINFTSSGNAEVDAQSIGMLRKTMTGIVDERIGLALRRVGRSGGRNNSFGMKK